MNKKAVFNKVIGAPWVDMAAFNCKGPHKPIEEITSIYIEHNYIKTIQDEQESTV